VRLKEPGDAPRPLGDVRQWLGQWLGTSGGALGASGTRAKTFFYGVFAAATLVAAVNALNVITMNYEQPQLGLAGPAIWEGTSWLSLMLFFWVPWIGYRLAPPNVRPRWKLLLHLPVGIVYALCHVSLFVGLRKLIYWGLGGTYVYGAFLPHFLYELRKDALGYALFIAGFALIEHLLRQQQRIETPGQSLTFDIRDGAKITRVSLSDILAVTSAGNYVEFVLSDGRRLMMRSPLSALERTLGGRGFLRTHRSWLVNATRMTALTPEGSGDYTVELETLRAPLSRRFPEALAKLKGG
jgi:hypothetical protein